MKRLKRRWIKLSILEKRNMKPVMARMETMVCWLELVPVLAFTMSSELPWLNPMVTVWKDWTNTVQFRSLKASMLC